MTLAPPEQPGRPFPVADAWAPAFDAVPRALFLPDLVWAHDMTTGTSRAVDRTEDERGWLTAAAADIPIVTQWDDGERQGTEPGSVPTSSASMPSLVASMLDDLRAEPGMRVLELGTGTGTGWNAALLGHRLGDANVTTVEIDPRISARARAALHAAGHRPTVVCADGALGWKAGAPYDRITATFGLRAVRHPLLQRRRRGPPHRPRRRHRHRPVPPAGGVHEDARPTPAVAAEPRRRRHRRRAHHHRRPAAPWQVRPVPVPVRGRPAPARRHPRRPAADGARTLWLYSLTTPACGTTSSGPSPGGTGRANPGSSASG